VLSLGFPLSKVEKFFIFIFYLGRGKGAVFCGVFCPLFRERDFGPHRTRFNYLGFYGSITLEDEVGFVDMRRDISILQTRFDVYTLLRNGLR